LNWIYLAGPFRPETSKLSWSAAARMSMYPTLGVLVVACPCALVLATPAAVIAALGRLAGTGVLIKGGSVLERLASVRTFAFDKTGTLTEGRLELGDIIPTEGIEPTEVLRVAALAEQGSEHPIAQLLVATARSRALPLENLARFQAHPGAGVSALVADHRLVVGTAQLMESEGIAIPASILQAQAHLDVTGQTSLIVASDGVVLGIIGMRDKIRLDAADVVAELRNCGISRMLLLTGDRTSVARAVGEQLRIEEVHGQLLPADKANLISPDQASIAPTAFVGDGINDAPALARATVGIAVSGSDIAAEAGDVVLMGEPLRHLPLLVRLSRETIRIIRQNIVYFAFGVNLVGVLITGILWPFFAASPDWYDKSPLFGVIYHQLGSLLVLLNSIRLLAFERRTTSASWRRWTDWFASIDLWMQRNFTVDSALHELTHRWRWVLGGLGTVALVIWLSTGLAQVAPDQVGVLKHFGKIEDVLQPGLHVRWPWPVEKVVILYPNEVKTVGLGYRSAEELQVDEELPRKSIAKSKLAEPAQGATWTSLHGGSENYAEEATMITGDGNLVEILATVEYHIDDPKQYLLAAAQRKPMLRSAMESVLREMVAGQTFADLLTIYRSDFEESAGVHLNSRVRELAPAGLGIQLGGFIIHDLHPPREVVADYYEVARAIQARDRMINEAQAEATRKRRRSEEDAIRIVNAASTSANELVGRQRAEVAQVLALQQARQHLELVDEAALFSELNVALMAGQQITPAIQDYLLRREKLVALRRSMIDMRLAWEALTEVLRKRDKVILDVEKLPGKRNLFLVDPDWLKPTMLVPPSSLPPRTENN
jgi:Cu+-exporting ATPase